MASVQNSSFLEDVACAEVNYAVNSQNWENSGVPLEPFNLKYERETGYFDEDGNYIAYCDAEPDDAWLESLPRGTFSSNPLKCACTTPHFSDSSKYRKPTDRREYCTAPDVMPWFLQTYMWLIQNHMPVFCWGAGPEEEQADEEESDGQGRQASNDDVEPQLSADTLRGYKEGIVDLLQPSESVFGALRRLAGLQVFSQHKAETISSLLHSACASGY